MTNPTFSLLVANIRMLLRDKQALFWSLVFPLIFLVIFGLFSFDEPQQYSVAFYDESDSDLARQLIEQIESIEIIERVEFDTRDEAIEELQAGELDGIITIPEVFGNLDRHTNDGPVTFNVLLDETNLQSGIIITVLNEFLNEITFAATETPRLFVIEHETVQGEGLEYIDFLMPGMLGMAIMFSSIIGIASNVTRYRERKILKRLRATPMNVRSFFIAEVGASLFRALLQIVIILSVAYFAFGVVVQGNYLWLVLATLIGTIIFLNIGFFVAGFAKNINSAESMSNVIAMPMMFLSGTFFPIELLPSYLQKAVEFLPLTSILTVLRGISYEGKAPWEFPSAFALMGVWIIVSYLLAWKTFKFERE